MRTKQKKLPPVHPGQVLKTVLEDAGMTANALALALRVPANRLTEILNERRSITADTALRLARYFGTSAQMWMNLQARFDLETAEDSLARRIESELQPTRKASWRSRFPYGNAKTYSRPGPGCTLAARGPPAPAAITATYCLPFLSW
jgi:antitoxin HigA-1